MNVIENDMPPAIEEAMQPADADTEIHVILLAGAGKAFCSGYALAHYAQSISTNKVVQVKPWDPIQDI